MEKKENTRDEIKEIMTVVSESDVLKEIIIKIKDEELDALYHLMPRDTALGAVFDQCVQKWRKEKVGTTKTILQEVHEEIKKNTQKIYTSFYNELMKLLENKGIDEKEFKTMLYRESGIKPGSWANIEKKGTVLAVNRDAHTSKENILKMLILLKADIYEIKNLLSYGNYSFDPEKNCLDCVIAKCVAAKNYDTEEIDNILYDIGESTLFRDE